MQIIFGLLICRKNGFAAEQERGELDRTLAITNSKKLEGGDVMIMLMIMPRVFGTNDKYPNGIFLASGCVTADRTWV